jgi:hypothetical protein
MSYSPRVAATATSKSSGAETSHTFDITIPALSGKGMVLLLVAAKSAGGGNVNIGTPTLEGVNLTTKRTEVWNDPAYDHEWGVYYKYDPAEGADQTVVVPFGASSRCAAAVLMIDRLTPVAVGAFGDSGENNDVKTLNCGANRVGSILVDLINWDSDNAPTQDASQTLVYSTNIAAGYGNFGVSYKVAVDTTGTMSWSFAGGSLGVMRIDEIRGNRSNFLMLF